MTEKVCFLDVVNLHLRVLLALPDELFDLLLTELFSCTKCSNLLLLPLNGAISHNLLVFFCQLFKNLFELQVFFLKFSFQLHSFCREFLDVLCFLLDLA